MLEQLGRQGSKEISLEKIRAFRAGYARIFPNGDGIVPLVDIEVGNTRAFCADVVKYAGEVEDAGGKIGYGKEQLESFLDRARAMRNWMVEGRQSGWTWGDATSEATAIVFALEAKLEQFFWQCDLLRVEPRAASRFELSEDELEAFDLENALALEKRVSVAPLSRPNAAGELNLSGGLNPHYEERIWVLRDKVLKRALGTDVETLTREDWEKVKALFGPHKAWHDAKPNDEIEALGEEKLSAYIDGELPKEAEALIERDLAVKEELEQIAAVEKLCLLQRWLMELANNFVNFSQLYDPNRRSLFEEGTLVIDGRELSFSMKVTNRSEHRKIVEMSHMFLVYAEITSKVVASAPHEKFELVVAVTSGQRGGIAAGKRGVFFDIEEREWDARILEVVENPISLWEAVKAPFQRIAGLAAKKVERIAAKQTESIETTTEAGLGENRDHTPRRRKACRRPGSPNVGSGPFTRRRLRFRCRGLLACVHCQDSLGRESFARRGGGCGPGKHRHALERTSRLSNTAVARHERDAGSGGLGGELPHEADAAFRPTLHPQAGAAQRRGKETPRSPRRFSRRARGRAVHVAADSCRAVGGGSRRAGLPSPLQIRVKLA